MLRKPVNTALLKTSPEFSDEFVEGTPLMISVKVDGEWIENPAIIIENKGETLKVIRYNKHLRAYNPDTILRAVDYRAGLFDMRVLS